MNSRTDLAAEARQMRWSGALASVRDGSRARLGTRIELVVVLGECGTRALFGAGTERVDFFAAPRDVFSRVADAAKLALRESLTPQEAVLN